MAKISEIIVHCSDSEFGNATIIDSWHKARGWSGIGYHYVILNGSNETKNQYLKENDGKIEKGRYLDNDDWITGNEVGAHCLGHNDKSIGICLIGIKTFTIHQLSSLIFLCEDLIDRHKDIKIESILGHCETISGKAEGKTCPNFNMAKLREMVKQKRTIPELISEKDFNFVINRR